MNRSVKWSVQWTYDTSKSSSSQATFQQIGLTNRLDIYTLDDP